MRPPADRGVGTGRTSQAALQLGSFEHTSMFMRWLVVEEQITSKFEQNALTTVTIHQKSCFPLGSLEHMLPWLCVQLQTFNSVTGPDEKARRNARSD